MKFERSLVNQIKGLNNIFSVNRQQKIKFDLDKQVYVKNLYNDAVINSIMYQNVSVLYQEAPECYDGVLGWLKSYLYRKERESPLRDRAHELAAYHR